MRPAPRTLRAVFDWSHELLSEAERVLLRRLAVFAGGANFEGVVALAAEDLSDEWDLLDLLEALIDKSLVIADLTDASRATVCSRRRGNTPWRG